MPEILDLYDADMRPLNRTVIRGEPIPQGCYHIVVIIMTASPRTGKILMTKRAPEKSRSGMWEITGGSKQSGETAEHAACRELYEETGITVTEDQLIRCGTDRGAHWFFTHFAVFADEPEDGIRLQPHETVDSRWVTPAELLAEADRIDPSGRERTLYQRFYGRWLTDTENREEQNE